MVSHGGKHPDGGLRVWAVGNLPGRALLRGRRFRLSTAARGASRPARRQLEPVGEFRVAEPFGQMQQDLALPPGQPVQPRMGLSFAGVRVGQSVHAALGGTGACEPVGQTPHLAEYLAAGLGYQGHRLGGLVGCAFLG
ncbi:hypothetical protein CLM62_43185 [Streptomyces sp. SA15]|nr:hypothetical protein CLM62_43185 [Streptomyces sp. SA15]